MRSTPRYKSKYECYRVVKGLEFNEKEIEELKVWANTLPWETYITGFEEPGDDYNYVCPNVELQQWVLDKLQQHLLPGCWFTMLKNHGDVPWHRDDHRQCSMTIFLGDCCPPTISPTRFACNEEPADYSGPSYSDDSPDMFPLEECRLFHKGYLDETTNQYYTRVYLQNNRKFHHVSKSDIERTFLQISFPKEYSYNDVCKIFEGLTLSKNILEKLQDTAT